MWLNLFECLKIINAYFALIKSALNVSQSVQEDDVPAADSGRQALRLC